MLAGTACGADFGLASDRGELVAQALAYEHDEGVAKDQRRAALLYCEAARAGGRRPGRCVCTWMDVCQWPPRRAQPTRWPLSCSYMAPLSLAFRYDGRAAES